MTYVARSRLFSDKVCEVAGIDAQTTNQNFLPPYIHNRMPT